MPDRALRDFVELQRGNTYKSALLGLPGPKLLGLGSIQRNGGFKGDNLKSYGGESDPRILLGPGDIYVSLKDVTQSADLLGAVARVPPEITQGRLTQDTVKLAFKDGAPASLIYWVLRSPDYRAFCRSYATGTTNLGLPREDFLAYPIPELTAARLWMVTLLDALDDKIELNRRMNETLEAMARALFKDWFVDFGPTRAKMEDRAPYLAPDIWSLFPDRLDDEGKPEGWEVVPLASLIEVNPAEQLARGTPAPYLDMASIPTEGPSPSPYIVREFESGMRFRNGDTLLARIAPCLENGKTAFIQALPEGTVGWGSTEFIVLRPRPPVPSAMVYLVARDPAFRGAAIRSMTGTSGRQRASYDAIRSYPLMQPDIKDLWAYVDDLLAPMFERIAANERESQSLAAIRDLLLPKLMSGEVRLQDAERIIGRAI